MRTSGRTRGVAGHGVLALAFTVIASCGQTISHVSSKSPRPSPLSSPQLILSSPSPSLLSPSPTPPPLASPTHRPPKRPTARAHPLIAVIVMENHEYDAIMGNACCPYINSLVGQGTLFTNFHAVAHPSLPNYLAMTSGSTNGKAGTDAIAAGEINAENVFHQLSNAGLSWNAFQEGMPAACFKGAFSGRAPYSYALKHDPAMTYLNVAGTSLCNRVVPATGITLLPDFSFITPNLCFDMHSCPARSGDEWLRVNVGPLVAALGPTGRVIITWDEGTTRAGGGGHIVTLVVGQGVPVGQDSTPFDHYSLLAGIESAYGLPRLQNAAGATPLPLFIAKP